MRDACDYSIVRTEGGDGGRGGVIDGNGGCLKIFARKGGEGDKVKWAGEIP